MSDCASASIRSVPTARRPASPRAQLPRPTDTTSGRKRGIRGLCGREKRERGRKQGGAQSGGGMTVTAVSESSASLTCHATISTCLFPPTSTPAQTLFKRSAGPGSCAAWRQMLAAGSSSAERDGASESSEPLLLAAPVRQDSCMSKESHSSQFARCCLLHDLCGQSQRTHRRKRTWHCTGSRKHVWRGRAAAWSTRLPAAPGWRRGGQRPAPCAAASALRLAQQAGSAER